MKKYLFILFVAFCFLFNFANATGVKATVNTQKVERGNPIQLRIEATGGATAFPNITSIAGEKVENSGESKQSNIKITINGTQKEVSTVRKYIFVPKHDMTIPSYVIRVGNSSYRTKPISIKVIEPNRTTTSSLQKKKKISFLLKSKKHSVKVGELFMMKVYLSLSKNIRSPKTSNYIAPHSINFYIKQAGEQKIYEDNEHIIVEKRYTVIPKKEGNFIIEPAKIRLGHLDENRRDFYGRLEMVWQDMTSSRLNIKVEPLNADVDLVGDFDIETKIDTQSVKANKPVSLTVKIKGNGNLEDFEFSKYDINDVTVYSDDARINSDIKGATLLSSYSKSFAFIGADDFEIPSRIIRVYNPNTNKIKELKIPSYVIHVKEKITAVSPTNNASQDMMAKVKKNIVEKKTERKSIEWWMLLPAFVLGMFMMYLLHVFPKIWQRKGKKVRESDALKILYAHVSEEKAIEDMVRKLYARKNGDKSVKINKNELKIMLERFR